MIAHSINEGITQHGVDAVVEAITKGGGIKGKRIAVLGQTYKPEDRKYF